MALVGVLFPEENNMATTSKGVSALYTAQLAKRSNTMAYGKKKKKKPMKPRPKKY